MATSQVTRALPTTVSNCVVLNATSKEEKKPGMLQSIFNTALEYLKLREGVKNTCKVGYHVVDWMKQFREVSPATQNFRGVTNDAKNVLSVLDAPGFVRDLGSNLAGLTKVKSAKDMPDAVKNTFLSGVRLTSPACDGIVLANDRNIIKLAPEQLKMVKTVSYTGLAIGTGAETIRTINKINEQNKKIESVKTDSEKTVAKKEQVRNMIDLAKFASYAALGIFGILSMTGTMVVASWVLLSLSTSALVFTIGGFFYNKMNNL